MLKILPHNFFKYYLNNFMGVSLFPLLLEVHSWPVPLTESEEQYKYVNWIVSVNNCSIVQIPYKFFSACAASIYLPLIYIVVWNWVLSRSADCIPTVMFSSRFYLLTQNDFRVILFFRALLFFTFPFYSLSSHESLSWKQNEIMNILK